MSRDRSRDATEPPDTRYASAFGKRDAASASVLASPTMSIDSAIESLSRSRSSARPTRTTRTRSATFLLYLPFSYRHVQFLRCAAADEAQRNTAPDAIAEEQIEQVFGRFERMAIKGDEDVADKNAAGFRRTIRGHADNEQAG